MSKLDGKDSSVDAQTSASAIDEGLYSRQLYVLGHRAMRKMANANVLICGATGLGIEIAKNVVLAGVNSVTIHDVNNCELKDLSSQYFLNETDVGKNRADRSVKYLRELNSYVCVDIHTEELTADFIKKFTVVVLTNCTMQEKCDISQITHKNDISLVIAATKGLFGQIFCDFGEHFTTQDSKGEPPVTAMIESIIKGVESTVTCVEKRHGFEDGDFVTFSEVEGMTELNTWKPWKVKVTGSCTFIIGDTSRMGDYVKGGFATQVIMPKSIKFLSFIESLRSPKFVLSDLTKQDRPSQLHLGFQGLDFFKHKHDRLPRPWHEDDADELFSIVQDLYGESDKSYELDENLLHQLSYVSSGDLCPMQSVIGGIAAQEVLKACGEQFHPIVQWFYFDALECLPKRGFVGVDNIKHIDCRYDGQISVFGQDLQDKLANLKYFLVGAGAIGCEHLKNMTMMGISSGKNGKIIVTDMDRIERSNLNRQFLFKTSDIGKWKSEVAEKAVRKMNPHIHIEHHKNRVGQDTEKIYDEVFYENLDGVANALDNVDARLYMDEQCVYHRKPTLESGTLGTKGNVQVIIPFVTESYSSSPDPPEKFFPICTLKVFPNTIEHTLQWARDEFEGLFKKQTEKAQCYLKDRSFMDKTLKLPDNQALEVLQVVKNVLVDNKPESFDDCVAWARLHWEDQYVNQINQLLYSCPPDQVISLGVPFWSGQKRCPKPLKFNSQKPLHLDYIVAASNLKAFTYGIDGSSDRNYVSSIAEKVKIPEFIPKHCPLTDEEDDTDEDVGAMLDTIVLTLQREVPNVSDTFIRPIEFEKDDDANFHLDFVVAASNLRASNYGITMANRFKSKQIAGKIIPAIATTTAVVSGLACLELYKMVQNHKEVQCFKNSYFNLSLPFFTQSEPMPAQKLKFNNTEFTLWDRIELRQEMTLKDFLTYFKKEYKLEISVLCHGSWRLYSPSLPHQKKKERLDLEMGELLESVTKKPIESHVKALVFQLCCDDVDGKDVEVPCVKYILPKKDDLNLDITT